MLMQLEVAESSGDLRKRQERADRMVAAAEAAYSGSEAAWAEDSVFVAAGGGRRCRGPKAAAACASAARGAREAAPSPRISGPFEVVLSFCSQRAAPLADCAAAAIVTFDSDSPDLLVSSIVHARL